MENIPVGNVATMLTYVPLDGKLPVPISEKRKGRASDLNSQPSSLRKGSCALFNPTPCRLAHSKEVHVNH